MIAWNDPWTRKTVSAKVFLDSRDSQAQSRRLQDACKSRIAFKISGVSASLHSNRRHLNVASLATSCPAVLETGTFCFALRAWSAMILSVSRLVPSSVADTPFSSA